MNIDALLVLTKDKPASMHMIETSIASITSITCYWNCKNWLNFQYSSS
jgi:hypothetical protein